MAPSRMVEPCVERRRVDRNSRGVSAAERPRRPRDERERHAERLDDHGGRHDVPDADLASSFCRFAQPLGAAKSLRCGVSRRLLRGVAGVWPGGGNSDRASARGILAMDGGLLPAGRRMAVDAAQENRRARLPSHHAPGAVGHPRGHRLLLLWLDNRRQLLVELLGPHARLFRGGAFGLGHVGCHGTGMGGTGMAGQGACSVSAFHGKHRSGAITSFRGKRSAGSSRSRLTPRFSSAPSTRPPYRTWQDMTGTAMFHWKARSRMIRLWNHGNCCSRLLRCSAGMAAAPPIERSGVARMDKRSPSPAQGSQPGRGSA